MKYTISRDKYFSFKEYPTKNNKVNKISGNYAKVGNVNNTSLGISSIYEIPKTLNTEGYVYYIPEEISANSEISFSDTEKGQYNKGFCGDMYCLKCIARRHKTVYDDDWTTEILYEKANGSTTANINETSIEDYKNIGPLIAFQYQSNKLYTNSTVDSNSKIILRQGYYEAGGGSEPKNYTYVQEFYTRYFVSYYGRKSEISYNEEYEYSVGTGDNNIVERKIQNNSLIQTGTRYNNNDIMSKISNSVFKNYKNGRRVAELDWVGNPDILIGDEVEIEPKNVIVDNFVRLPDCYAYFWYDSATETTAIVEGLSPDLDIKAGWIDFYYLTNNYWNHFGQAVLIEPNNRFPITVTVPDSDTNLTISIAGPNTLAFKLSSEPSDLRIKVNYIQQNINSNKKITYTIMGKKQTFNGGYGEKLYLVEKFKE